MKYRYYIVYVVTGTSPLEGFPYAWVAIETEGPITSNDDIKRICAQIGKTEEVDWQRIVILNWKRLD